MITNAQIEAIIEKLSNKGIPTTIANTQIIASLKNRQLHAIEIKMALIEEEGLTIRQTNRGVAITL